LISIKERLASSKGIVKIKSVLNKGKTNTGFIRVDKPVPFDFCVSLCGGWQWLVPLK
jgi:hypothetical protein